LPRDLANLRDCRTPSGRTPVIVAALNGNNDAVEQLASKGFSCSQADRHGQTPLSFACREGHLSTVKILLKNKADPLQADQFGCSPLHKAASFCRPSVLELLLSRESSALKAPTSKEGQYLAHRRKCCDPNSLTEPVSCPPEAGAVSLFETPLHLAVSCGSLRTLSCEVPATPQERAASIEVLLTCGANPNQPNVAGDTALHLAAKARDWGAMCRLRRAGADPSLVNGQGISSLTLFAEAIKPPPPPAASSSSVVAPRTVLTKTPPSSTSSFSSLSSSYSSYFGVMEQWRHRAAGAFVLGAPQWALKPFEPLCWKREAALCHAFPTAATPALSKKNKATSPRK